MVYKRYLKRGGKKYGPYYYTTIRTKDGKVKSVYIGKKPKKSYTTKGKPKNLSPESFPAWIAVIAILIFLMLGFAALTKIPATGLFVGPKYAPGPATLQANATGIICYDKNGPTACTVAEVLYDDGDYAGTGTSGINIHNNWGKVETDHNNTLPAGSVINSVTAYANWMIKDPGNGTCDILVYQASTATWYSVDTTCQQNETTYTYDLTPWINTQYNAENVMFMIYGNGTVSPPNVRIRVDQVYIVINYTSIACTDSDGDGYYIEGGACGPVDCDDGNNQTYPGATEICDGQDNDCDTIIPANESDNDLDGWMICQGDCNDGNSSINPGATEVCNNVDDDCDTLIDESLTQACGSGLCTGTQTCTAGVWGNCSSQSTDCGVCAICDYSGTCIYDETQDGDCSATTCPADGCGVGTCAPNIWGDYPVSVPNYCQSIYSCTSNTCTATCETDNDGDGYSVSCGDCNDTNSSINPGAVENCTDGVDNDCDSFTDCNDSDCFADPACAICTDSDGDGYYIEGGACGPVDCNDSNINTYPGAPELCDGQDNDCDTIIPANESDSDSDGWMICEGDCNDGNSSINPGATEVCNNVDDDCDTFIDESLTQGCGSGLCTGTQTCTAGVWGNCSSQSNDCGTCAICDYSGTCIYDDTQDGDCSPTTCPSDGCGVDTCAPNIWGDYPASVPNYCQSLYSCTSNTCAGTATCESDGDSDGYSVSCGDCNDTDSTTYPGATELCDGKDNNCDDVIPANEYDSDFDGWMICEGDCNDANASIYPGATEVCNNVDDDCDTLIDESLTQGCGSGLCTGTQTCTAGVWGNCSSQSTDCGVCAICDSTGTCTYDETQDGDCSPTTCPADGCGVDVCSPNIWGDYPASVPNYCQAVYSCTSNVCSATCEADNDGDGYSVSCGDCNDTDDTIYLGAPELCDGQDNDCDTIIPANESDSDSDGWMICEGDCNDTDNTTYPGAPELCDGQDNNCDTIIPSNESDSDLDSWRICEGDCDDTNSSINPGAVENCTDGVDNDCDSFIDYNDSDCIPDADPPGSVTNLNEIATSTVYITWNWTNPPDSDYDHVELWLDGIFLTNVSAPGNSYQVIGLSPSTTYELQTRTADTWGNINTTWVNDTATTKAPYEPGEGEGEGEGGREWKYTPPPTPPTPPVEEAPPTVPVVQELVTEQCDYAYIWINKGEIWRFTLEEEEHTLELIGVSQDTSDIQITSEPQYFTLILGEPVRVDLDGDGIYDIMLTLVQVEGEQAQINLEVLEKEVVVEKEEVKVAWAIDPILLVLAILLILGAIAYYLHKKEQEKKKRKRKKHKK